MAPGFVIVAKFYDIESGRTMLEHRGAGRAHEQFDIPVAVVCESIERIARTTYFSTKIEYELEQAGVALLAADEGIQVSSILSLELVLHVAWVQVKVQTTVMRIG